MLLQLGDIDSRSLLPAAIACDSIPLVRCTMALNLAEKTSCLRIHLGESTGHTATEEMSGCQPASIINNIIDNYDNIINYHNYQ